MSDYDEKYPVVAMEGDETVQVEIRRARKGVHFFGDIKKGTYHDLLRWRAKQLESGPTSADILEDMRRSGCPGRVVSDLRRTLPTKALNAATDFLNADRRDVCFLLLLGPPGVGKSLAAGHAMKEFGRRVGTSARDPQAPPAYRWIQAAALVSASNYGADAEWVRELERARLLVIDELGADAASRAAKAKVTELLLARHAKERGTILTSNLSHQDFSEVYGQALVERIRANGIDPDLSREKSMRERRP